LVQPRGVAIVFLDLYWGVSLALAGSPMIQTQSKVLHQLKVLEELDRDLQEFEVRYDMTSEIFIQRFQTGSLGDDLDFVEWNAFYHLNQSLQRQIELLKTNGLQVARSND
jgi:hypothetical protein